MILKNLNTATVEDHALEKWLHARTHIAKESGSIQSVSNKRTYLKNGTVLTVKSSEIKPETQYLEGFLSKNSKAQLPLDM
jgi:hypothetical protein